jgi:hypothetical protein
MLSLILAMMFATPVQPPPLVRITTPPPPIILEQRLPKIGDWEIYDEGDYLATVTKNESGSLLGFLCGDNCVLYVNLKLSCDHGDAYAGLINTRAGARAVNLKCYILEKRPLLMVTLDESLLDYLSSEGQIGFAVAQANGMFNVSRFSLRGGISAMNAIASESQRRRKDDGKKLRDFEV